MDARLRNLQSRVEIDVDKNTTVVFPAPLMSTFKELATFLRREGEASSTTIQESLNRKMRTQASNGRPLVDHATSS